VLINFPARQVVVGWRLTVGVRVGKMEGDHVGGRGVGEELGTGKGGTSE
jgi:hypothetical protein